MNERWEYGVEGLSGCSLLRLLFSVLLHIWSIPIVTTFKFWVIIPGSALARDNPNKKNSNCKFKMKSKYSSPKQWKQMKIRKLNLTEYDGLVIVVME